MITGLEYVLMAYGIWICTFVIYIFINKRRKKDLIKTIVALEKKSSGSTQNTVKSNNNENKE